MPSKFKVFKFVFFLKVLNREVPNLTFNGLVLHIHNPYVLESISFILVGAFPLIHGCSGSILKKISLSKGACVWWVCACMFVVYHPQWDHTGPPTNTSGVRSAIENHCNLSPPIYVKWLLKKCVLLKILLSRYIQC